MTLRRLLTLLCCVFALVFMISAAMAVMTLAAGAKEKSAFDELAERVNSGFVLPMAVAEHVEPDTSGPVVSEAPVQPDENVSSLVAACRALQDEQPDFAAWLKAEAAGIDYPVMDSEDYIFRAFDGSESKSGTPFIGEGGSLDSDMFIIYAHNMKNGSMFGSLDEYRDAGFWAENPVITLATPSEERSYEIFAAVDTRVLYEGEEGLRWYYMSGELDEDGYYALTGWLLDSSLYDTGVEPEYGQQLLLLSTCSYHTENGRFLVAARRISP